MAAALVMAVVKTLFRAMVPGETDLGRMLGRMNDELCRDNDQMIFITAIVGRLDLHTGSLAIGDVGHNPVYLVDDSGLVAVAPVPKAVAFGVVPGAAFPTGSIPLDPRRALVVYTDGVTDARSPSGDMFSAERLVSALENVGSAGPAEIVSGLRGAVERFESGAPPEDDVTILALRYRGVTS